jgi:hypothetical protein
MVGPPLSGSIKDTLRQVAGDFHAGSLFDLHSPHTGGLSQNPSVPLLISGQERAAAGDVGGH